MTWWMLLTALGFGFTIVETWSIAREIRRELRAMRAVVDRIAARLPPE